MKYFTGQPFFKGNLHLHTTVSDGVLTPEQACELHREARYDFVAITDHWKLSRGGWHQGMLLLPGVELNFEHSVQAVHLVCLGLDEAAFSSIEYGDGAAIAAAKARAAGARVILAHPAWSLNTPEMIASLLPLTAVEVYNTTSGPPYNGRADSSGIIDVMASNGALINLVAVDDTHFYEGEQCQAYIMLQADALTEEAVFAALDAGRFYATRGPRFEQIELQGDTLRVSCSPAARILFLSNTYWVKGRCIEGRGMTSAEYKIRDTDRFVRVIVTDAQGREAWSNPIPIEHEKK